ncbi:hypothetical protein Anas_07002 [Armadillidium nasatum]|uniref:Uncharacterized protein n=1 Tax=Armadillidium nasatum TaxID=96803 RepID=A0A5N5TJ95_9CRUS|nr:hypothetical protein Anas_07002 [Armadillidium nasatum]
MANARVTHKKIQEENNTFKYFMTEIAYRNLCRCTGYRPILEGFRTFAKDSIVNGCGKANCCRNKDKKILNGHLNDHDHIN